MSQRCKHRLTSAPDLFISKTTSEFIYKVNWARMQSKRSRQASCCCISLRWIEDRQTILKKWLCDLKETVHPKMKILSSFTHPQVDQTCMNVFVLNTKEDILKNEGNRAVFFSYYWSQWCPKTAWLQTFFRISSFVFRTNTFIQVWIYLRMIKWWQNLHFWVHCLFKLFIQIIQKHNLFSYFFIINIFTIKNIITNNIICVKINIYNELFIHKIILYFISV